MHKFFKLITELEEAKSSRTKVAILSQFLINSSYSDASWALYFSLGNKLPKVLSSSELLAFAIRNSDLPEWLWQETLIHVNDLAETLSLILKPHGKNCIKQTFGFSELIENRFKPLLDLSSELRIEPIGALINDCDFPTCFVFSKLIISSLKLAISPHEVLQSLVQVSKLSEVTLAARLYSKWQPTEQAYLQLLSPQSDLEENSVKPQTLQKIHSYTGNVEILGDPTTYRTELWWDGLRIQLLNLPQACLIWNESNQDISKTFPELVDRGANFLPVNTILDGVIVAWQDGAPLCYSQLQRRLNRKQPSKKLVSEIPIRYFASDVLFHEGKDVRAEPLELRQEILRTIFTEDCPHELQISPSLPFESWEKLTEVRNTAVDQGARGILLKSTDTAYLGNSEKQIWWKWSVDPLSIFVILIYVSCNQNQGIKTYEEFTFGVWKGDSLVPVAKIKTDFEEASYVIKFIEENITERFGPVCTVKPELVFNLSFEDILDSNRHKSGVALRNPKVIKLCKDKLPVHANRLEELLPLRLRNRGRAASEL